MYDHPHEHGLRQIADRIDAMLATLQERVLYTICVQAQSSPIDVTDFARNVDLVDKIARIRAAASTRAIITKYQRLAATHPSKKGSARRGSRHG